MRPTRGLAQFLPRALAQKIAALWACRVRLEAHRKGSQGSG